MGTISCQHLFYNFLRFFLQNTKNPVKTGLFVENFFHFTRLTDGKTPLPGTRPPMPAANLPPALL